jgi:alcohol dehydrogenase
MQNFEYCGPTRYFFGRDAEKEVGKAAAQYGKKVLLHYGGGSIKKIGLYDTVVKSLKESGIEIFELGGVQPNPRVTLVRQGVEICKKENIDLILAVGGGSVIDSAKAISAGAHYDGDVWDFYLGKVQAKKTTPVATVLTIAAAGSEGSDGSVITNEEGALKRAYVDTILIPKFSVLNPQVTASVSRYQTFAGVTDILAHLMERYFTNVKNVELTDRLIEATMKTVMNNAKILVNDLTDYDARAEVMWGGTVAHNNLLNTGRIGDWASHDIEHELSGIYDVSHGAGLAVIFPAWMKFVYKHDIDRFVQFAVRVFNVENDHFDKEKTALAGIKAFEDFMISIDMPIRLDGLGIDDKRLEEMAQKAAANGPLGNFVPVGKDEILAIYKLAL